MSSRIPHRMRGSGVATRRASASRSFARGVEAAFLALEGIIGLSTGYLLVLLAGARHAARKSLPAAMDAEAHTRFAVLVPAHNEERIIDATLAALAACDYPADLCHVIVIADNCTDRTAVLARQAGVEVWERCHATKLGKGHALTWGMERLCASPERFDAVAEGFDAVVVLDADCLVSPNMFAAIDVAMRSGAHAVQVDYVVDNPTDSHASALRFAAFTLMCTVRPLGKQGLGLSCGLFGTGMAFTMELLRREPWTTTDFGEDFEYHLRLLHAGQRVEFLPHASVKSAMPTSFDVSTEQQTRWEKGKLQLMRNCGLPAVVAGVRRGDFVLTHAGLEQFVPPQSLIAAGSAGSLLAGLLLRSRRLLACSLATLVAQLLFVLGGLRLVRAPRGVYRALIASPALIAGKIAIYVRLLGSREPMEWVRTEREPSSEWEPTTSNGTTAMTSNGTTTVALKDTTIATSNGTTTAADTAR
jgi:Glycosyltransferase like family 2